MQAFLSKGQRNITKPALVRQFGEIKIITLKYPLNVKQFFFQGLILGANEN